VSRIYLASSWRNTYQPDLVTLLRTEHEVYDFRHPQTGGPPGGEAEGFSWKQTDPNWGRITPDILERYKAMLRHPVAAAGFNSDFNAMKWADTCVLVLPCGRSAHLEAGWMSGAGKKLVVYMPPATTPCQECGSTGLIKLFPGSITDQSCMGCAGEGHKLVWSFEPELMYLVGGEADLITTSTDELMEHLRQPSPLRKAIVWDPQTMTFYTIMTDKPYPIPGEKVIE
jgi:hypothetical protein